MKTEAVIINPPESLVSEVRHLKAHFPYRICWGAFNTLNTSEQLTGANYDKRKFNRALRQPAWAGFTL